MVRYMFWSILINGILPWFVYMIASNHLKSVTALLIATMIPLIENLIHIWKHKKLDVFGSLMLFTFALSLGLAAVGGDEHMLLLRESFITGSVGIVFIGSLCFRHPILFHLAQSFLNRDTFRANWKYTYFRTVLRLMTAVWGFSLVLESIIRIMLVFRLSTAEFLAISNLLFYGCIGILIVWTVWYRRKSAKKLELVKGTNSL